MKANVKRRGGLHKQSQATGDRERTKRNELAEGADLALPFASARSERGRRCSARTLKRKRRRKEQALWRQSTRLKRGREAERAQGSLVLSQGSVDARPAANEPN